MWLTFPTNRAGFCFPCKIAHLVRAPSGFYSGRKGRTVHLQTMTNQNPGNYLRVHRKESGFNQEELGDILGCDGGAVSRFEWSHSLPSLPTALAFEVLFMVPISELFSGLSEAVRHRIEHQITHLEAELGSQSGRGPRAAITAKKLQWLTERRLLRSAS